MERELWITLYQLAQRLDTPWGQWLYSTADIVGVYCWAVLHERPVRWATQRRNWPPDLGLEHLPDPSTVSRRMHAVAAVHLLTAVEEVLRALTLLGHCLVRRLDGKALPVSRVSQDREAGYGRGAGGFQKGYKLHAVCDGNPMPVAWALAPMNVSEKRLARLLIPELPGRGYLLADAQYDANPLYDLAAQAQLQLLAPKTKSRGKGGLGHRRQSPARLASIALLGTELGQTLDRLRGGIERHFGQWSSYGGGLTAPPSWVRGFRRVRHWLHAKLLIHGTRWLLQHVPQQLAFA